MAFNFVGGVVKTAGNFAGDVVSLPDKAVQGTVNPGQQSLLRITSTAILCGKRVAEVDGFVIKAVSVIIVGPVIFAFYKAKGYSIGDDDGTITNEDVRMAKDFLQRAEENGITVVLPKEVIVSKSTSNYDQDTAQKVVAASEIPDGWMAEEDMAPSTFDIIGDALKESIEIEWNGYPVKGLFRKFAEAEEDGATIEVLTRTTVINDSDQAQRTADELGSVHFGDIDA